MTDGRAETAEREMNSLQQHMATEFMTMEKKWTCAERERDEARVEAAALREALLLHIKWNGGASHHIDDCPGACEEHKMLATVEAALATTSGRDELERRQKAEARVLELTSCQHPPDKRREGPRRELRHGSAPTEVCGACGAARTMHHEPGMWCSGKEPT